MQDVRREGRDLGDAATHKLRVDEDIADVDVGKKPRVAIPLLNIEDEPDHLALVS